MNKNIKEIFKYKKGDEVFYVYFDFYTLSGRSDFSVRTGIVLDAYYHEISNNLRVYLIANLDNNVDKVLEKYVFLSSEEAHLKANYLEEMCKLK